MKSRNLILSTKVILLLVVFAVVFSGCDNRDLNSEDWHDRRHAVHRLTDQVALAKVCY